MWYKTVEEYFDKCLNIKNWELFFPEYKLTKFFKEKYNKEIGIYCFADSWIKYLIEAYNKSLIFTISIL